MRLEIVHEILEQRAAIKPVSEMMHALERLTRGVVKLAQVERYIFHQN